jgi:type I restriction enzyme S subunit
VSTPILDTASVRRWRRYPEYKVIPAEWQEELPAHWQVKRLKFVADLQTGLTLGKDYSGRSLVNRPYLRVANVQDGYLALDTITEVGVPAEEVSRYELRPGDVLMTEGGDFDKLGRGYVWEGQIPGCLHQNHVFAVRPQGASVDPRFLAALMTSSHGKAYFTSTSQQTTNLATTNSTKLKSFPLLLPPLPEQRAIVAFLDRETARIDALIAQKKRLIALLEEKRQAVISHAATKGLDPTVPLTDSKVPWFDRYPSHWKAVAIGWIAEVCNGSTPSQFREDYWEEGVIPWVSSGEVNEKVVTVPTALISAQAFRDASLRIIPTGSVLMGMIGQGRTRGLTAILGIDACINQNVAAIIPGPLLHNEFLNYALTHAYEPIRQVGRGGQQGALNCELIRSLRILVPPKDEQVQIASYLNEQTRQITELVELLGRHNRMLQEYRSALISAAVTGQIDVRQEVPT